VIVVEIISCNEDVGNVDGDGGHVASSRSFDNSIVTRPDVLSLSLSIPEETAVEIADTAYAPLASPDEPQEHPVSARSCETSRQDVDSQMQVPSHLLDDHQVAGDTDAAVKSEIAADNDLLPNGKQVPYAASSPADSKPATLNKLQSVLVAVAAILICALIGAIIMFEFDGTAPFSSSLHAIPGVGYFHRNIYRPLNAAVGRSLPS